MSHALNALHARVLVIIGGYCLAHLYSELNSVTWHFTFCY